MIYLCCSDLRRTLIQGSPSFNGIDFLEVLDDPSTPPDQVQRTLFVHFVNPVAAPIGQGNVRIEGGERIRGIQVSSVAPGDEPVTSGVVGAVRKSPTGHLIDAMRGIHVGLGSGRKAPRVSSGPLLISGNTVRVRLTADATRARHGIFVGNTDSLVIENCHLSVTRALPAARPVDGIRIWGTLGRRVLVRQNHVAGFTVGARVVPLAPFPVNPLWRVAGNLLVGGLLAPGSVVQTTPAAGAPLNVS